MVKPGDWWSNDNITKIERCLDKDKMQGIIEKSDVSLLLKNTFSIEPASGGGKEVQILRWGDIESIQDDACEGTSYVAYPYPWISCKFDAHFRDSMS